VIRSVFMGGAMGLRARGDSLQLQGKFLACKRGCFIPAYRSVQQNVRLFRGNPQSAIVNDWERVFALALCPNVRLAPFLQWSMRTRMAAAIIGYARRQSAPCTARSAVAEAPRSQQDVNANP
jgi:hypothetical protein